MADLENIRLAKAGIRLFSIWKGMQDRCERPQNPNYHRYGGRGIKIEWPDFDSFLADMLAKYQEGLTLDRIDNNGNYSLENCRWATMKEQANNRSTNVYLEYKGKSHTIQEWANIMGLKVSVLGMRLRKYGWSVEKALTTPVTVRTSICKKGHLWNAPSVTINKLGYKICNLCRSEYHALKTQGASS